MLRGKTSKVLIKSVTQVARMSNTRVGSRPRGKPRKDPGVQGLQNTGSNTLNTNYRSANDNQPPKEPKHGLYIPESSHIQKEWSISELRPLKIDECYRKLSNKNCLFVCLDTEWYERDSTKLTEIGISVYDPRHKVDTNTRSFHLVVQEYLNLRNGRYVPDHKDYFMYGESYLLSLQNSYEFLDQIFHFYNALGREIVLIGHGIKGDITQLKLCGYTFPEFIKNLADTQVLWDSNKYGFSKLERITSFLDLPTRCLHNGGNDAHCTLQLFIHLCGYMYKNKIVLAAPPPQPKQSRRAKAARDPITQTQTGNQGVYASEISVEDAMRKFFSVMDKPYEAYIPLG